MSDPEVARYMPFEPLSEDQTQEMVRSIVQKRAEAPQNTPLRSFGITLRENGRLIGACRLGIDANQPDQADLAYLLNRRYWNQGYATEAVRTLIDYGFEKLGLHRIYALCLPENVASWRVMEKVGMSKEAPVTRRSSFKGADQDLNYLAYAIYAPVFQKGIRKLGG